ncbi:flagellar hook-associated protein FlgK [Bacillus ginsengihumi]|uniref:Flagellar hook-associated protein 1 n=1 Tax=Heyndrickxia ginsengihumi TaxID=363870 RepID=A0A6M0P3K6_9BACI|nr:flagellar hook-associated protein FlgK [Heyndrickxia ginsengihumi]NEY19161.1 flagellar hook-associated protein FlgK [Heyndrickxia ginsengihumi]
MSSTFSGLEIAKRAMAAQQSALYTVGNNVANANTEGYTRQRVNLTPTDEYPTVARNRPQMAGQIGTGVEAGSVQRVREKFLDVQYRDNNNTLGYWNARSDSLSQLEDVMNDTSDSGLSNTLEDFWESIQDLSTNPEDVSARSVVIERGETVADTFHYLSQSLSTIKSNLGSEISVSVNDINSILKRIGDLNKQISQQEVNGYLPNDLYDQRDNLVDQLSSYLNIKVSTQSSGGQSPAMADGIYNITLENGDGQEISLVQGSSYSTLQVQNGVDSDGDGVLDAPPADGEMTGIVVGDTTLSFADANGNVTFAQGKLRGSIESYGYQYTNSAGNTVATGIYPDALDQLDQLAYTFGTVFNAVHEKGTDLDGNTGNDFFTFDGLTDYHGAANALKVDPNMTYSKVAASTNGDSGDGTNAINLGNIEDFELSSSSISLQGFTDQLDLSSLNLPISTGTIASNYEGMIGKIGVDAQEANNLQSNSENLLNSVDSNRQSVSAVSLDEELTNMIKYQQAYNAAARSITVCDEMLDKIINSMGTVGR